MVAEKCQETTLPTAYYLQRSYLQGYRLSASKKVKEAARRPHPAKAGGKDEETKRAGNNRWKKRNPAYAGLLQTDADIRNRRAVLAAILYASLLMTLRFLRYIHGQKVKPGEWLAVVAIGNTPCKP